MLEVVNVGDVLFQGTETGVNLLKSGYVQRPSKEVKSFGRE